MKNLLLFSCAVLLAAFCAACAIPATSVKTASVQVTQEINKAAQTGVRVLVAENKKTLSLKNSGTVFIYPQDKNKKYKVSSPRMLEIKALGNGRIRAGMLETNQTIVIEPAKNTLLSYETNPYSGTFYVIPNANTFHLVENVPLETYLYGVLPYEMSHSWPAEALKAQAVSARTYTLKTLETVKNKNFDVYSDVRSQMYKGGGKPFDSVKKAVDATNGQFLTYQDKLFYTFYHGNCGGATDDVTSWNSGAESIKPLSGSSCKYDSHSANYSWTQKVPLSKVDAYAKSIGLKGTSKNIKITRKTDTGRATNLEIKTKSGSKTVPCGKFRAATGIKSCKITKISIGGREITFKGRGSGHGVGMCQDGANGMAKDGKTYQQILKNYYPGAELTR